MTTILTMILDWVIISSILGLIYIGAYEIRDLYKENKK